MRCGLWSGGLPGARQRPAGGGVGDGSGCRAELGEFVSVGVGLAFGVFGSRSQVGAQLVVVAGGVSAEGGQHLVRVGADPAGLGLGCLLGGLGTGGFLLGQPGGLLGLHGCVAGLVPVGLGDADQLVGLGAGLPDRGVSLVFGSGDPGGGVSEGRFNSSGLVDYGRGACCLGLVGAGLGGGQLRGHLLGGGVGLSAPLVGLGGALLGGGRAGFGGGGALLGGRADGFHLGFGGGRVGHRLDGLPESVGDFGYPVGFGAQQAQQFRASYPGHGHRSISVSRAGRDPGRRGRQATAFPPSGDLGMPSSLAVFGRAARPGRHRRGRGAAGVLACVSGRGGSGGERPHLVVSGSVIWLSAGLPGG